MDNESTIFGKSAVEEPVDTNYDIPTDLAAIDFIRTSKKVKLSDFNTIHNEIIPYFEGLAHTKIPAELNHLYNFMDGSFSIRSKDDAQEEVIQEYIGSIYVLSKSLPYEILNAPVHEIEFTRQYLNIKNLQEMVSPVYNPLVSLYRIPLTVAECLTLSKDRYVMIHDNMKARRSLNSSQIRALFYFNNRSLDNIYKLIISHDPDEKWEKVLSDVESDNMPIMERIALMYFIRLMSSVNNGGAPIKFWHRIVWDNYHWKKRERYTN